MSIVLYCIMISIFWILLSLHISDKLNDYANLISLLIYLFILNNHIKMIMTKLGIYGINSNAFGEYYQLLAIIISDIGMCLIVFSFMKNNRRIVFKTKNYNKWIKLSVYPFAILFFVSGFILFGGMSWIRLFSLKQMQVFRLYRNTNSLGNGIQVVWSGLLTISLLAIIYCAVEMKGFTKQRVIAVMIIIVFTWYLYANQMSKTVILMAPVSAFIYFNLKKKKQLGKGYGFGSLAKLTIPFFFITSITEIIDEGGANSLSAFAMLKSFFVPSFDVIDNLTAILARMNNYITGEMAFKPFLYNVILSKIPRAFFPGKYEGGAKIMIVEQYLREYWNSSSGYMSSVASCSFVGDALISGGIFFYIIICMIYGKIFRKVYFDAIETDDWTKQVLYAYVIIMLNEFCRGGSGILGQMLLYIILMSILKVVK